GIIFWFVSEAGFEKCVYTDSRLSLTGGLTLDYNDHPQNSRQGAYVQEISLSAKMTPQQIIGKDRMYENPSYDFEHRAKNETVQTDANFYAIYDSYARFPHDDMGQQIAEYRLQAIQTESESGEAISNCSQLRPGKYFELMAHPAPELNRQWQIVRITHHGILPHSMEEEAPSEPASYHNQFHFISAQNHWRAPFK